MKLATYILAAAFAFALAAPASASDRIAAPTSPQVTQADNGKALTDISAAQKKKKKKATTSRSTWGG